MSRNFLQEFRDRIQALDHPQPRFDPPAPVTPTARKPKSKRYNIHKRSLPPGIDRIVFFNVSKAEASLLVEKFLKAKAYQDDARDSKTVIYYDIIPVGAEPHERSIFYNERPFVKEEGSDPEPLEIITTPEWIG